MPLTEETSDYDTTYPVNFIIVLNIPAVASKYGTLSLAMSVSNIKQVVWNSFITNIRF